MLGNPLVAFRPDKNKAASRLEGSAIRPKRSSRHLGALKYPRRVVVWHDGSMAVRRLMRSHALSERACIGLAGWQSRATARCWARM